MQITFWNNQSCILIFYYMKFSMLHCLWSSSFRFPCILQQCAMLLIFLEGSASMCRVKMIGRMAGEDKVFWLEGQTSTYGTRTPLKITMSCSTCCRPKPRQLACILLGQPKLQFNSHRTISMVLTESTSTQEKNWSLQLNYLTAQYEVKSILQHVSLLTQNVKRWMLLW